VQLSERELVRWGRRIGETVATPAILALSGELGAGKSVFARAVGQGAGVEGPMPSPTFTLLQRYAARRRRRVVHLDLYRLDSPDELWELGWSQLGEDDEIVLIEWAERAGGLLSGDHWRIELTVPAGLTHLRDVDVSRVGSPPDLPGFPLTLTEQGR